MLRALLVSTFALALAGCAAGQGWPTLIACAVWLAGLAMGCGSSHGRGNPVPDAGPRDTGPEGDAAVDAGGGWERCCNAGVIDTCYCPAGWACNYGLFEDCGDGTCIAGPGDCAPPDAGPPDAGGHWESCCVDGMVDSCFCPAGASCNYGWYTPCGDGTCVGPTDVCTADAGAGG